MTTQTVQTTTDTSNATSDALDAVAPSKAGPTSDATTMPSVGLLVAHLLCAVISFIIIHGFWEFENVSAALAFYGVYHRYGWNQVIHFVGVPGILWTLFIFMVHIPVPIISAALPFAARGNMKKSNQTTASPPPPLNYALFMAIAYGLFYLRIDPIGGTLFAPVLYGMYRSAVIMRKKDQEIAAAAAMEGECASTSTLWYGTGQILKFAAALHALCWYSQIHLGHKIIEGAQPAVLQSLGGALTVAPLFAFYEGLWLVGINRALQESTKVLVDQYTLELCSTGQVLMKACESIAL
jgi:uncharacterized membrane protein YGL010W